MLKKRGEKVKRKSAAELNRNKCFIRLNELRKPNGLIKWQDSHSSQRGSEERKNLIYFSFRLLCRVAFFFFCLNSLKLFLAFRSLSRYDKACSWSVALSQAGTTLMRAHDALNCICGRLYTFRCLNVLNFVYIRACKSAARRTAS